MRDPVGPIPSPAAPTARAASYWHPRTLPPPPPLPGERPSPPAQTVASADTLGIDRRRAPRDGSTALGAAVPESRHEPVPRQLLGVRSEYGWTLARALTICPAGLLVQGVDLLDAQHDAEVATQARAAFVSLAPALGAPRRGGAHSFLGLVSGCLLAPRLLEDLAQWGSGLGARPRPSPIPVTLLLPGPTEPTAVRGVVAPLTDPQPDVLAIALTPGACAQVRSHLIGSEAGVPAGNPRPARAVP